MSANLVRRFVRVDGRGVHYLRAGEGPPVVLLHYAEVSASSQLPLLELLANDHTVFAFDHPGHGDSDPLGIEDLDAAEAADALSAALSALEMPPCPVYGILTGAATALELGRRHPEQVSGVVIDGPCMFEQWEAAYLRSECFMPRVITQHDGSHLFSTWVRMRDGIVWLPWNQRQPVWRFSNFLPDPDILHGAFLDMVLAGDDYRFVYRSAITDGREAAAALTVPATFMAGEADPLYEHLDRLPSLKSNQEIVRVPTEALDWLSGMGHHLEEAARIIRQYQASADAPPDAPFRPSQGAINRRYVDLPEGQILVRSAGEERQGKPVLLLHDGRASSRVLEPLMRAISRQRSVYAVDIPDNGASDPHTAERPDIVDYANSVAEASEALELDSPDIYAVGAGAAVALELFARPTFDTGRVVLEAPDFYSASFARRLADDWVPPIAPAWDGAHINRVWLMLRDEYAFWPWFDKTPETVCKGDAPTDWSELHARAVEVFRSLPTYHRLTMAALRYDWASALAGAESAQVTLAVTDTDPRRPHVEAAAREAGMQDATVLPERVDDKASSVLELLGE